MGQAQSSPSLRHQKPRRNIKTTGQNGSKWGRRGSKPVLSPPSYVHLSTIPNTVAVPPSYPSASEIFMATSRLEKWPLKTTADPPTPVGGFRIFSLAGPQLHVMAKAQHACAETQRRRLLELLAAWCPRHLSHR